MENFDFQEFKKSVLDKGEKSDLLSNNEISINKDISISLANVYMFLSIVFRYPTEEVYNELFSNFNKFELFFEEYIETMPSLPYREDLEPEYVALFRARKGGVPAPLYSSVYTEDEKLTLRDSTIKLREMMLECGFQMNEEIKDIEDNLFIMLEFLSSLISRLGNNEYCKKEIIDRLYVLFKVTDEYILGMLPLFVERINEYAELDFYKQMASVLKAFIEDADNLYFELIGLTKE
jgi:TorA maturation chaperone TorD